jgi:hypothetical protein
MVATESKKRRREASVFAWTRGTSPRVTTYSP